MVFTCKFCQQNFKTKSYLITHQKKTKYCLKIQGKLELSYKCKHCFKFYYFQSRLDNHLTTCLKYHKYIIDEKNNEIFKLKNEIRKLKNDTNDTQLLLDLDAKKFSIIVSNHFSNDYLILGQKGVAKFMIDYLIKSKEGFTYKCDDIDNQIFIYNNVDGILTKDIKAKKLIQLILDSNLKNIAHTISCVKMNENTELFLEYSNYYDEIKNLKTNNKLFLEELIKLITH
jgi:hypothetical protein